MTLAAPAASRRSAAEIEKGALPVMHLSEADVVRLLDPAQLLDGLSDGFAALARGEVQTPDRPELTVPDKGFSLAMPAWRKGTNLTIKIVNVFEANLEIDLPNHLAVIMLFDPQTGAPLCIMDGTHITAIRTAASAVLSVHALSRPEARIATLIGAGVQGREHLRLLPLVREFDEIRIASLHYEDAETLAANCPQARPVRNVEAAVRGSDVVCLASHAYEPVIASDWVRPGTHVSSVGYAPPRGELPTELLGRAKLFVETDQAFRPPPVGCAELAGMDASQATMLGELFCKTRPGRESPDQITLYKAMGIAMQDLVAADIVYRRARAEGIAQYITL
jgi:alanine dehydrogenase